MKKAIKLLAFIILSAIGVWWLMELFTLGMSVMIPVLDIMTANASDGVLKTMLPFWYVITLYLVCFGGVFSLIYFSFRKLGIMPKDVPSLGASEAESNMQISKKGGEKPCKIQKA